MIDLPSFMIGYGAIEWYESKFTHTHIVDIYNDLWTFIPKPGQFYRSDLYRTNTSLILSYPHILMLAFSRSSRVRCTWFAKRSKALVVVFWLLASAFPNDIRRWGEEGYPGFETYKSCSGWWYSISPTPLKNISIEMMKFPICGKMTNVPNHQSILKYEALWCSFMRMADVSSHSPTHTVAKSLKYMSIGQTHVQQ